MAVGLAVAPMRSAIFSATCSATSSAEVVAAVVQGLGRLDILVNNAGILRRAPAVEFAAEGWEASLSINLSAAFYLSQAAAARFIEAGRGGKIVNLASMLSFQGGLFVPAYTATKSAIAGLTRSLANEWARHGVNVNAIGPCDFDTPMIAGALDDPEYADWIVQAIPAGRIGQARELAGAAIYLASDASDMVAGHMLMVDGGRTII